MDSADGIRNYLEINTLDMLEFGYAVSEKVDCDGILHAYVFRADVTEQEDTIWEKIDPIPINESAVLEF